MSSIWCALAAVALSSLIAIGGAIAQQPSSSPLSPAPAASDKAAAKKKAAEDRKMKQQKTAGCQKQAKDQKLTGAQRTTFIQTCMARPF
jgi:hypothetical protein